MTRLGYDPQGQIELMQILKEASGGGQGSEFFATHPLPDTRIRRLTELLEEEYAGVTGTVGRESFQENVLDEFAKLGPPAAALMNAGLQARLESCGGACGWPH